VNRKTPMGCGPNVDQATTINLPSQGSPCRHALAGAACLDRAAISALIASRLSNRQPRANTSNGVTGYDKATLLREWALEALMLPSNRDHAHVDPTPSAPPITSSTPDKLTVALATHAGGLRAHHWWPRPPYCPNRHRQAEHPPSPCRPSPPSQPRAPRRRPPPRRGRRPTAPTGSTTAPATRLRAVSGPTTAAGRSAPRRRPRRARPRAPRRSRPLTPPPPSLR
jgi:hypothetical protein